VPTMASACAAYVLFHCSSRELQARAGFDGWVMLLRDQFDTEDQAWPQEQLRLAGIAKRKMRRLEAGGVELDMLQLVTSCHLLLEPPQPDREEERIWCIEYFRGKMYDFVADDRELVQRLNSFQDELLMSARRAVETKRAMEATPSTPPAWRQPAAVQTEGGLSARPSGDDAACAPPSPGLDDWSATSSTIDGFLGERIGERKAMSAASLSAALDLSDLESAQQRFSGGAFLPILPLGTDDDSVDRGQPTTMTSTGRWDVM